MDADPGDAALAAAERWRRYMASAQKKQVDVLYLYSFGEGSQYEGPCPVADWRNDILYIDCGVAVDGPAYLIDEISGEIICGSAWGRCWRPGTDERIDCEALCPPPGFVAGEPP